MSIQDDLPFEPPLKPLTPVPPARADSSLRIGNFDVSVRAGLATLLTITVCYMSVAGLEIKEPLYTLVGLAIGLYFGQKK